VLLYAKFLQIGWTEEIEEGSPQFSIVGRDVHINDIRGRSQELNIKIVFLRLSGRFMTERLARGNPEMFRI